MFAYMILGFVVENGKYLDFSEEVLADSPMEAAEIIKRKEQRAVVSTVSRKPRQWDADF